MTVMEDLVTVEIGDGVLLGFAVWAGLLLLFVAWLLWLARRAIDRQEEHNRRMEEYWRTLPP